MKFDHVHKYKRILLGSKEYFVYRCMTPGCTHYIQMQAAVGRESVCWGVSPNCNGRVFITEENIELKTVRPMCDECKRFKKEQREALQTIPMIEGENEDE